MDAPSNVQTIVKEPVDVLVWSSWSVKLTKVIVTVAWHECAVGYCVSITRNTLAISTQCTVTSIIITPDACKIFSTGYYSLTVCAYMVMSTSLQAITNRMFITSVQNISKLFLHFLIFKNKQKHCKNMLTFYE